jgi:hypothetical protein
MAVSALRLIVVADSVFVVIVVVLPALLLLHFADDLLMTLLSHFLILNMPHCHFLK